MNPGATVVRANSRVEVDGMKPSKNSDLGKQTRLTRAPWREEGAAFPSFLARVVAHRIHESLEPAALVLEPRERPKPGFPPLSPDRPIMYTQPPLDATSNLPFRRGGVGWGVAHLQVTADQLISPFRA